MFRGPPCPNCGSEWLTTKSRPDDSWITFGGHDVTHDLHRCLRCFESFSPESDEGD
ncbi:hypothetical protein [Halopelagius inordinatus]|uniref:hypothetical protein n=1 Tax=Halopelagius inordinatus TaxID=553467 RepID=UPI0015A686E4|nr:hypothetical protein [Halopelagius inordinatus]